MENETLEQVAERLKNFQGNVKGEVFRVHAEYIKHKEGEEGVKRVEEKMKEIGMPINFNDIEPFAWINEGKSSMTLVVAKEIFNWTNEDIFEMGHFAPKFSFIIKVMIQYLVSMENLIKSAQKYWDKHFDFGEIETEFFEGENKAIIREKGYPTPHPITCLYHTGYFTGLCEFAVKSGKVKVTETKCHHKGDNCNEFLVEWE